MGQTGFCENLRSPVKICGFLQKSAPPKCYNSQEKRKSAKISENLRKTANSARFVPFSLSLLIPLERRLLQKSEGNFSEQVSGRILRGIFRWIFGGPFSLKKQEEKSTPKSTTTFKSAKRVCGSSPRVAQGESLAACTCIVRA